jgi:hypothetical protein
MDPLLSPVSILHASFLYDPLEVYSGLEFSTAILFCFYQGNNVLQRYLRHYLHKMSARCIYTLQGFA